MIVACRPPTRRPLPTGSPNWDRAPAFRHGPARRTRWTLSRSCCRRITKRPIWNAWSMRCSPNRSGKRSRSSSSMTTAPMARAASQTGWPIATTAWCTSSTARTRKASARHTSQAFARRSMTAPTSCCRWTATSRTAPKTSPCCSTQSRTPTLCSARASAPAARSARHGAVRAVRSAAWPTGSMCVGRWACVCTTPRAASGSGDAKRSRRSTHGSG